MRPADLHVDPTACPENDMLLKGEPYWLKFIIECVEGVCQCNNLPGYMVLMEASQNAATPFCCHAHPPAPTPPSRDPPVWATS